MSTDNVSIRVHPAGTTEGFARSELYWLQALHRDTDLLVPEPLRLEQNGGQLESTFGWIAGETLEGDLTPEDMHSIGQLAATLHRHADALPLPPWFDRPRWSFAALERQLPPEKAPEAIREFLMEVRSRTLHTVQRLDNNPYAFSLVHGDLHLGNLVRTEAGIAVIDFGDCSFSAKLRDLTIPLTSWEVRHAHTATHEEVLQMEKALVAGYRSVIPLQRAALRDFGHVLAWARSRRILQVLLTPTQHAAGTVAYLAGRVRAVL